MALTMRQNQPKLLFNCACAYCGETLTDDSRTKEHVIGRRFVPIGSLQNSWNLILQACRSCNNAKSSLEDDVGAISLQPNVFGQHAVPGELNRTEAARRAGRSASRLTGKLVSQSAGDIGFELKLGGFANGNVSFRGPAQVSPERLFELASYHLRAFFFLLTYSETTRVGGHWPGVFMPLNASRREDWGNALQMSFQRQVRDWPCRLVHGGAADGWFKVAIRKHPSHLLWSWAFEWNQNFRVLGFVGDEEACRESEAMLHQLNAREFRQSDGSVVRMRENLSLREFDDVMFWAPQPA